MRPYKIQSFCSRAIPVRRRGHALWRFLPTYGCLEQEEPCLFATFQRDVVVAREPLALFGETVRAAEQHAGHYLLFFAGLPLAQLLYPPPIIIIYASF